MLSNMCSTPSESPSLIILIKLLCDTTSGHGSLSIILPFLSGSVHPKVTLPDELLAADYCIAWQNADDPVVDLNIAVSHLANQILVPKVEANVSQQFMASGISG